MNIRSCSPLPTYSEHGFQVIINDVELSLSLHTSLLAPMRVARGLSHAWSCLMVFLGLCCVAGSFLIEPLQGPLSVLGTRTTVSVHLDFGYKGMEGYSGGWKTRGLSQYQWACHRGMTSIRQRPLELLTRMYP